MRASRNQRERGVAIVVSLFMLVLLAVLAVGLLSISSTNLRSTKSFTDSVRTRQIGDLAVQLAVSQIRQATSREHTDGTPKPWTSQPGAIRSYSMEGDLDEVYKLYTASSMVTTEGNMDQDVPEDWHNRLSEFVDLNHPTQENGELVYPIADPRSDAEGFEIDPNTTPLGGSNPLPMPVRWLYTLADGTLGHLDESLTFIPAGNGPKPTPQNPIVGRFAFWVDDESSKINVNTASEGVFWDTPRADTKEDRLFSRICG